MSFFEQTPDMHFRQAWEDLLPRLRGAGVSRVECEYSGAGDEGFIQDCALFDEGGALLGSGSEQAYRTTNELVDEVMTFANLAIDHAGHAGYENNEGGGGTLKIDVAAAEVRLSHYDIYEDQSWSQAAWDQDGNEIKLPTQSYGVIRCLLVSGASGERAKEVFDRIVRQAQGLALVEQTTLEETGEVMIDGDLSGG